jgi:membrane associated rhomboid family serine protease
LIAAAQVLPDAQVLIYGVIPARLRTVAWILLGVAIYTVFTNGKNAGGEAAHLGGAAVGYLLIRKERLWDRFGKTAMRGRAR